MVRFLKFFVVIFCVIAASLWSMVGCGPRQPDFCFAFVADTHITLQGERGPQLKAIVRDINGRDSVDFVILDGDITEFGSDEEIAYAKSILDSLNKPFYVLSGNHDAKWSESGCNTFKEVFGREQFFFEKDGILFVGTNSGPNMRMAPALMPRESMVWLRQLIAQIPPERPVVFVNHYPINADMDNWQEVLALLQGCNLQMCLCGHYHRNDEYSLPGGVPGVKCRSVVPNKHHPQPGYNVVRVKGRQWTFREALAQGDLDPWKTVTFREESLMKDAVLEAPDYGVNALYPQVKEIWAVQDSSDIGAAAIACETSGKVVYTNTRGDVSALSLEDGRQLWRHRTGGKVFSTPAIAGDRVYVGSTDRHVYCLDLETGCVIWSYACEKSTVASPVVLGDKVYIGASDGKFRALDAATGNLIWEYRDVKAFVETRPYVDAGQLVFGDWANRLYSLDPETGALQWTWTNGKGRMYSPAAVWPVKSRGKIFMVTPERRSYALDARTGRTIWTAPGGREAIGLSPDGSKVYVKTMFDSLFCFAADAGRAKALWQVRGGYGYEIAPSALTATQDKVFVPTDKGLVYAFSAADGTLCWVHRISVALVHYVTPLSGNRLLVSAMDGKMGLWQYE